MTRVLRVPCRSTGRTSLGRTFLVRERERTSLRMGTTRLCLGQEATETTPTTRSVFSFCVLHLPTGALTPIITPSLSQLLSRAFRILRSQNPELAGDRRRYTIAPPQMLRDGNKKTIFANLADICKRMHRSDEHVISFLYAELGTSGSVDGSHRLIIKGRYTQKHMENVLRKYIGQSFLPRISSLSFVALAD